MTPHTAPDAAAISASAADIIHQDAPTLDSRSFSASTDAAAENRRRRKTTSAAVKNRYAAAAYDRMELQLVKGDKQALKDAAAALDMSPTALIIAAVNAYCGREILTVKAKNPYI